MRAITMVAWCVAALAGCLVQAGEGDEARSAAVFPEVPTAHGGLVLRFLQLAPLGSSAVSTSFWVDRERYQGADRIVARTPLWALPASGNYEVTIVARPAQLPAAGTPTDTLRLILLHDPAPTPAGLSPKLRALPLDLSTKLVYRADLADRLFESRIALDFVRRCLSVRGSECVAFERFGITEPTPWIGAAVGAHVPDGGVPIPYEISVDPALGCSPEQISDAQDVCRQECIDVGDGCRRSHGFHECRAYDRGGFAATCALECAPAVDCAIDASPSLSASFRPRL